MDNLLLPHGDPHHRFHHRKLDFLVISPPKTGSTWLAANLRTHPQLFVPELKEIKYFSSLYKWLDLGWYSAHFDLAGSRRAGEASPSYASLPLDSIRQLRRLYPALKLVYLMRDPVSRAWSHAKHNQKYREANFATDDCPVDPAAVADDEWRANFSHEWTLASGDYMGQLRRWTSVFPKSQLYIGFYESIVARPTELLQEIFQFLEVDRDVDLSGFPVGEHFLPGSTMSLPPNLASTLQSLLRGRTEELIRFLNDNFELEPPPEWQVTIGEPLDGERMPAEPFRLAADDDYISDIMAMEETFPSAFRFIEEYRGFTIAIYRGRMYSFPRSLGRHAIITMAQATLQQMQTEGNCITGSTLIEVKERITDYILSGTQARIESLQDQLQLAHASISRASQQAQEDIGRVAADLAALSEAFHRPTRARRLIRALRKVFRRLVRFVQG